MRNPAYLSAAIREHGWALLTTRHAQAEARTRRWPISWAWGLWALALAVWLAFHAHRLHRARTRAQAALDAVTDHHRPGRMAAARKALKESDHHGDVQL